MHRYEDMTVLISQRPAIFKEALAGCCSSAVHEMECNKAASCGWSILSCLLRLSGWSIWLRQCHCLVHPPHQRGVHAIALFGARDSHATALPGAFFVFQLDSIFPVSCPCRSWTPFYTGHLCGKSGGLRQVGRISTLSEKFFIWPLAISAMMWQKSARSSKCCGSSVVEHTLGKGEVESSILSRSTIQSLDIIGCVLKPFV